MGEEKQRVLARTEELRPALDELCQFIHSNPETGFHEYLASEKLTDFLEGQGFTVERGCAGLPTAFRAEKSGVGEGPVIGILCEYDALPGLGHACGHNIIATSSVGAAASAAVLLSELGGRIVVLGTPSEEGSGGGKVLMRKAGVMDDLDCAMMFHPGPETVVQDKTLAINALSFTFHGVSAHAGAAQEDGRNALEAVIQTFNGINSLRGHLKREVNIHGVITNGGVASNIIPNLAAAEFGIRARTKVELAAVVARVEDCARGAALMTGCEVEINRIGIGYDDLVPNVTLLTVAEENLRLLEIPIDVLEAPEGFASTDVGNLSHELPAVQIMIGVGAPVMPHTPPFAQVCAGERGVEIAMRAAKALALMTADLLCDPALVSAAKRELEKKCEGEALKGV